MKNMLNRFTVLLSLATAMTGAWAAGEVQLLSAKSHGCVTAPSCFPTTETLVEIQNLGAGAEVGLRYRTKTGAWADAPGIRTTWPAAAGKELWHVAPNGGTDAFAVYYKINGVTYWDNNNSRNYTMATLQDDALLGKAALGRPQGSRVKFPQDVVTGQILVKNLSYAKTVEVVYTDDNWASSKVVLASYKSTYPSGIEAWSFSAPIANSAFASKIQLAFHYTWSNGSAWDNNFGRNYVINSQNVIAPN